MLYVYYILHSGWWIAVVYPVSIDQRPDPSWPPFVWKFGTEMPSSKFQEERHHAEMLRKACKSNEVSPAVDWRACRFGFFKSRWIELFDSGPKVHENRKRGNKVLFIASELGSRRFRGCLKQVMAWIKLEQFREALDLCTAPQPRKWILWGGGHWSLVAGPTFGDAFDWRMSLGLVLLGDGFRSLCRWLALTL